MRLLHPLWEEYLLKDGSHLFFNPYTGQVSKELARAAPDCLGGILADEMGLGKTVMMISLIHSNPFTKNDQIFKKSAEKRRKLGGGPNQQGKGGIMSAFGGGVKLKAAGTLIIVPVTLLSQWESEFEVHSKRGTVRVYLYYGDRRSSA